MSYTLGDDQLQVQDLIRRVARISAEYPINRYFRDAKVLQIVEGTNQIQRNIIANSVLGRSPSRN